MDIQIFFSTIAALIILAIILIAYGIYKDYKEGLKDDSTELCKDYLGLDD